MTPLCEYFFCHSNTSGGCGGGGGGELIQLVVDEEVGQHVQ